MAPSTVALLDAALGCAGDDLLVIAEATGVWDAQAGFKDGSMHEAATLEEALARHLTPLLGRDAVERIRKEAN